MGSMLGWMGNERRWSPNDLPSAEPRRKASFDLLYEDRLGVSVLSIGTWPVPEGRLEASPAVAQFEGEMRPSVETL